MKTFWNELVKTDTSYENKLLWIAFPAYTIFYLIAAYYAGLYDRWYKRTELIHSTLFATIVLLAAYSLLPEQYRFSRAIILLGSMLTFILISLLRWALVKANVLNSDKGKEERLNTIVAGSQNEYKETAALLKEAGIQQRLLGRVAVVENDAAAIGYWKKLQQLLCTVPFKEIIFCEGVLSFKQIIEAVQQQPAGIITKIHAGGSRSIVGSQSKDTSGESLSKENGYKLSNPYNRRLKRLIDICFSFFSLLFFLVPLLIIKKPFHFFGNCFSVLLTQKTWIGYAAGQKQLPLLQKGIIGCNGTPLSVPQQLPKESLQMMDYWYAWDYEPATDIKLLWKNYKKLGG